MERLREVLAGKRVVALTGAGCSTESGIPDYRGPKTRHLARNPVQFKEFVRDPVARRRYWARALVGWPRMRDAEPNRVHRALAQLEATGRLVGTLTQNVDGLHGRAGSLDLVELHGSLAQVTCLQCGAVEERDALQERLLDLNPSWRARSAVLAPDGDAEIDRTDGFRIADCLACGGLLKPRVVFFGENVPAAVLADARALFDRGDALLVVGSSLAVFSGLRFVRWAHERSWPIAIVNLGPTRGDAFATVKVDDSAGDVLEALTR